MSRSVTVSVAYIMSVTSLDWKNALKVVRVGRAVANPNSGFQKQLQEFEYSKLSEERKRLKERFPSLALVESDEKHCRQILQMYQRLIISKHLCEGNCNKSVMCPTGSCYSRKNIPVRKHSINIGERSANSKCQLGNTQRRPRSGPAVLMNFSSAPSSRTSSKQDLTELDKPEFQSAPVTPQTSPYRKSIRRAPLVDLDEITDS